MPVYPSLKSQDLLRLILSLGYTVERQKGSHRRLTAKGRPASTFAFHDGVTVPPRLVRSIPERQIGLSEAEIDELLGRK